MNALRRQDGFTMAELLVGMTLMMIVMAATLLVLDQFTVMSKRADGRTDVQDQARNASRQIARSLRNLAASPDAPGVVERAGAYNLVFRTVDKPRADAAANTRNLKRVRYCLDSSDPARGRLLEQTMQWNSPTAPPIPTATECPTTAWGAHRVLADGVANRTGATDRPLWEYGVTAGGQIASVKLNLLMKGKSQSDSREVGLHTGVFLRNQNRAPTAEFTATAVGVRHVLLNGSASQDPEGQPLDFHWYANGVEVGRGLVFDYYASAGGSKTFQLEVFDPGGISSRSLAQTVVIQ
jgi:type II secretory pathway pseudopilin PulG